MDKPTPKVIKTLRRAVDRVRRTTQLLVDMLAAEDYRERMSALDEAETWIIELENEYGTVIQEDAGVGASLD